MSDWIRWVSEVGCGGCFVEPAGGLVGGWIGVSGWVRSVRWVSEGWSK